MRALLLTSLALVACGPGAPKGGTAQMRFAVSNDVKNSMNLKDPLKGTFYGQVFLVEDVSITGPRSDAKQFQYVEVANIDLTAKGTGEASDAVFTTEKLEPNTYVVLGFFDVDGNSVTTDRSPDPGDPVTLALTNKFEVSDGAEVKRLVLMELVFN